MKLVASFLVLALALAGATFGMALSAHAYSSPPSWMPMTMLNVSFNPSTMKLDVVDQATKMGVGVYAGLTLAPLGTYDPTQPYAVLNGTQYSRRLGWDDANKNSGDPALLINNLIQTTYGAGAGIWIDCLSKSAGLESYLAVGMNGMGSPNSYSGIFGTAGSDSKWKWDGMMDHNTYAVGLNNITSPGQLFSATYKVYIGDANGVEILNPDTSSASTRCISAQLGGPLCQPMAE